MSSYGVVITHVGQLAYWKVTFGGRECLKTDVQEFAIDFAYMMNAVRDERLKPLTARK